MKHIFTLFILVATVTGSIAQQTLDLKDFSAISLRTSGTVNLIQGNEYRVVISGSEEALEETKVYVRGGTLVITNEDNWSWFGNKSGNVTVDVTTPKIDEISVSGSGKVYGKNKFKTTDLDLAVSGSGKMEIECEAESTEASVSGSGKIYIKGTTDRMRASISGSGDVEGEDFKSKECRVTISGSGSCDIYVEKSLDARISGSGSVHYGGNPDHVDSHTSGSGRVKKI